MTNMNMNNFIIYLIIFLLLLNLITTSENGELSKQISGYCFNNQTHEQCLPFSNMSLTNVWNSDQISNFQLINDYIEEDYIYKKKFSFSYDNSTNQGLNNIKTTLKEEANKNDVLSVFFQKDELIHSKSYGRYYFNSFPEIDEDLEIIQQLYELPDEYLFPLCILYHLYHIEYSKLSFFWKAFPQKPNTPLFTITQYEMDTFLKNETVYPLIKNQRKNYILRYQKLKVFMHETLTEDEIKKIFRNRTEIPLDDFIYAIFLTEEYGLATQVKKESDEYLYYILPIISQIKLSEKFEENRNFKLFFSGRDQYSVRVLFNKAYEAQGEIELDLLNLNSDALFLMNGHIPISNDKDCVQVQILDEKVAESAAQQPSGCFHRNSEELDNYIATAIVLNMNEEQNTNCLELIKTKNIENQNQRMKIFFNECNFDLDFKKFDFLTHINQNIEEAKQKKMQIINKITKYIDMRKSNNLPIDSPILIQKYLELRIKNMNEIKTEIYQRVKNLKNKRKKPSKQQPKTKISDDSQKIILEDL